MGGRARAKALSAEARSAIARVAVSARWSKAGRSPVGEALGVLGLWLKRRPGDTFAERGLAALESHYAQVGE